VVQFVNVSGCDAWNDTGVKFSDFLFDSPGRMEDGQLLGWKHEAPLQDSVTVNVPVRIWSLDPTLLRHYELHAAHGTETLLLAGKRVTHWLGRAVVLQVFGWNPSRGPPILTETLRDFLQSLQVNVLISH
jgi:hypothetical protein